VTIHDWLTDRTPEPPARLRARVASALGSRADRDATEAPEQSIAAAESLLRDLLARPTAGRESALDLLAVDALVTYAFEAAAHDPSSLVVRADDAMTRLAALA
jgi:hypothetical protein